MNQMQTLGCSNVANVFEILCDSRFVLQTLLLTLTLILTFILSLTLNLTSPLALTLTLTVALLGRQREATAKLWH